MLCLQNSKTLFILRVVPRDPKFVLVDVGSTHYGPIFWQTLGKNPILVGYVVLGIGYGLSAQHTVSNRS